MTKAVENKGVLERDYGLDIIKTLAILFVVSVHFFLNTKFYRSDLTGLNLFIQTCLQQLFLACIPLFLISTGYLNNNTRINKNYFKKIIPILVIYIFYTIPAIIYRCSIDELDVNLKIWIVQFFDFKAHRYSWYINLYFGLFLIIPFLNKLYYSLEEKKEKRYLIAILTLLTMFKNFVPDYWGGIYPLTYFFIGKYIKDYQPKIDKKKGILFLILLIILQASIEFILANGGRYSHFYNDYASFFRMLQAILIVLLLYKTQVKKSILRNTYVNISTITLDIYLASFITDRLIYKPLKVYNLPQETYLFLLIPLVLASFCFAYLCARIRKKYIKIENII